MAWCVADGVWRDDFSRNGWALVFGCGGIFADDVPDTEPCDGCAVGIEKYLVVGRILCCTLFEIIG